MVFYREVLVKKGPVLQLLLFGLALAQAPACGSDDPLESSGGESFPQSPGVHQGIMLPRNQRYTISIPAGYNGGQATPLVLALHFGGEVTPFYGGQFMEILVRPALQDLGAIIVAPDALAGGWANAQSEADLLALLDAIQANYNIDTRRTLVTGFSMGGRGTWYMAARHPERFTAAIPMAASPEPDAANIEWGMPLLLIHSIVDEVVAFEPVEAVFRELKDKGVTVEMIVVNNVTHFQTQLFVEPLRAAVPWVRDAWQGN